LLGIAAYSAVHALGADNAANWQALSAGHSGLRPNALAWCTLPCWVGEVAEIDAHVLPEALSPWDCRNHRLAHRALTSNGFDAAVATAVERYGPRRVAVVVGTSTSGIRSTEIAYLQQQQGGGWPQSFDYRKSHSLDALCRFSASLLGLHGPLVTISTACSSSAKVFLTAQRWIECGLVDAAVVGGVDSLCLSTLHGFNALQLLSSQACRPFDVQRDGISIGEAGGFVLLDKRPAALNFVGGGESSDAWHMSAPHPQGRGAQTAMRAALVAAKLQPAEVGYVNAHGTGTPANDKAEAFATAAVFGERAVAVSSTKGATGHTLGAAGITEAVVVLQALQHQVLPPTAHVESVDPALALDVLTRSRPATVRHAMSNSFGFGGNNCSLIFGRAD
jgi:3-oxoacyl-[acyl-carrier-protein] synthase-1